MRLMGLTMLLVGMVAAAAVAASPTVAAAASVPDVTLQAADGAAVRLSTFSGKVLLVDFWASWCVPCKTSFPALDAIYREYEPKGLEVVAVNLDEHRKSADAFLTAHPHRMTVLFDPKGIAPEAFGVKGMPSSFLIDRSGAIRFTHMGYSGNVDVSYRNEIAQLLAEP
jgi:cytochrome c biogenesis protein CcmG/thiol:disulfide interchange protein DsbE